MTTMASSALVCLLLILGVVAVCAGAHLGDPCTDDKDCSEGLVCYDDSGTKTCRVKKGGACRQDKDCQGDLQCAGDGGTKTCSSGDDKDSTSTSPKGSGGHCGKGDNSAASVMTSALSVALTVTSSVVMAGLHVTTVF